MCVPGTARSVVSCCLAVCVCARRKPPRHLYCACCSVLPYRKAALPRFCKTHRLGYARHLASIQQKGAVSRPTRAHQAGDTSDIALPTSKRLSVPATSSRKVRGGKRCVVNLYKHQHAFSTVSCGHRTRHSCRNTTQSESLSSPSPLLPCGGSPPMFTRCGSKRQSLPVLWPRFCTFTSRPCSPTCI